MLELVSGTLSKHPMQQNEQYNLTGELMSYAPNWW